jgi:hypothetical protein
MTYSFRVRMDIVNAFSVRDKWYYRQFDNAMLFSGFPQRGG